MNMGRMPDMGQKASGGNAGDPRKGYPDAADMPELMGEDAPVEQGQNPAGNGGKPPEMNPLLNAAQTMTMVVKAMEEQGNPKAAAAKEHLVAFLQTLTGNGESATGQEPQPEPTGNEQPQGEAPVGAPGAGGGGGMEQAGYGKNAKVMA